MMSVFAWIFLWALVVGLILLFNHNASEREKEK